MTLKCHRARKTRLYLLIMVDIKVYKSFINGIDDIKDFKEELQSKALF